MCAIGGLMKFEPFTKAEKKDLVYRVKMLLLRMTDRGMDATGIGLVNTKTNELTVYKNNKSADKFVKEKKVDELLMRKDYNLVLLHTRASTHGNPKDNRNNHPLYDKKTNEVIIHNGIVYTPRAIEETLKCDGNCDSERILRVCQSYGVKNGLKKLSGDMAIALWSKGKLDLFTNSNPLCLSYLPQRDYFVFASMKEYIETAYSTGKVEIFGFKLFNKAEEMDSYEFYENDFIEVDFETRKLKTSKLEVSQDRKWTRDEWYYDDRGKGKLDGGYDPFAYKPVPIDYGDFEFEDDLRFGMKPRTREKEKDKGSKLGKPYPSYSAVSPFAEEDRERSRNRKKPLKPIAQMEYDPWTDTWG